MQLYEWLEDWYDASSAKLLLIDCDNQAITEFTPFVPYAAANGIGYLETAFILNEHEVLCISGQTQYEIYNIKLNTRSLFQLNNVDIWSMGHTGLYLANAFLLDKNTLCDVRMSGQITIYDIPTRLIIDEYDIPVGGWLNSYEQVSNALFQGGKIVLQYENCSYEIALDNKLQSLSEDIILIDQFWK